MYLSNGKYLESIVDDSVIACDKIIYVMDRILYLANSGDKKVRRKM